MATGNDIKALVDNPKSFLEVNRLGYSISKEFKGEARVKLERPSATENLFNLVRASESDKSISAYLLGYKANEKNDALFLEVPSKGVKEEGKFLFTPKLTGCSLVVTRGKAADTYRVFHDYRSNSAVLYDNVIMYVDFDDYKLGGDLSAGTAVACMQFREGAWKLFVQQQFPSIHHQISENVTELRLDIKDTLTASLQKSFDVKREWMQHRIKDLAKTVGVSSAIINNAKDGVYKGKGEFNENDPCINEWNKLRDAIEIKLQEKQKKDEAEAAKLKKSDPARWKTKLMNISTEIANYRGMVHASKGLDKIWLWLQIFKVTGSNANQY